MQRFNAASCLLFAFLSGTGVCEAAERVAVHVVETHSGITLGPGSDDSAAIWSYCDGTSGRYQPELGFYCGKSRASLAPMRMSEDSSFFFDVRVVMPDSARIVYHCSTILNNDCEGFPEYPQKTAVACLDFVSSGRTYKDCTARGSGSAVIGVYRAALHGDRMTIFGPTWHRHYHQYGIWQLNADVAQDAKPAPSQEPTPASPPASKPASPPESNPAAAPDPKPATPSESKPSTPSDPTPAPPPETDPAVRPSADPPGSEIDTAESKSDTPPVPRLTSALTANPVIDPRIIEQAKAGDPESQYKLGYYYYQGKGVPIDYVQAAIWWRKAADQGYPQAQNNLGVLYNAGKGVPQSYAEAYFWQNLAASRASGPLQVTFSKNRDESAAKLWLLSRLKVQQRAAKWAADHPVAPRAHEPLPEEKRGQYP